MDRPPQYFKDKYAEAGAIQKHDGWIKDHNRPCRMDQLSKSSRIQRGPRIIVTQNVRRVARGDIQIAQYYILQSRGSSTGVVIMVKSD